ncbi:YkgJ family cysteine cluster protein [Candidatus Lokiarchaeum ossiferum]|uniref:YkgJ family cysteine cluster protein n=1 Tax=Candidatus Lokiarchaeum ossiferum TaxID=2951803 RepID=UPI00352D1543
MKICKTCGICCQSTEMELSIKDINRIEESNKTKHTKDDFCSFENGYYILKNVNNSCIFYDLKLKQCQIYSVRPEGCRFYPMIYNIDQEKCELDSDCPYRNQFYQHPPVFKTKCKALRKWVNANLLKD